MCLVQERAGGKPIKGSRSIVTHDTTVALVFGFIEAGVRYCDRLDAEAGELVRVIDLVAKLGGEAELRELIRSRGK